ncbi:MAG: methyltransferase domain-containing protein [Micromonosporaceae bacterium]|nr:methyltransferase domain-containing protein [Micromonosporaceae bacterium]
MLWSDYLARFHRERAGITELVLSRCVDRDGATPYDWLAELAGPTAQPAGPPAAGEPGDATPVLDLACGSAPLWPRLAGRTYLAGRSYLGVDRSAAELSLAAGRGAAPLVRADAAALPVADRTIRLVVCAMALMITQPLPRVLAEIGRVLRADGRLVAIVPASRPLTVRDVAVVAGLAASAGRLSYPNDAALADPAGQFRAAGLRLVGDQARRFAYPLTTPADADALLASLYLPGVRPRRVRAARGYLRALARVHATVPVPIRRLDARADRPPA